MPHPDAPGQLFMFPGITPRKGKARKPETRASGDGQPAPIANDEPYLWDITIMELDCYGRIGDPDTYIEAEIREAVRLAWKLRDLFGLKKYGVRLQPFNGRDFLKDMQDEIADAAVYYAGYYHESGPDDLPESFRGLWDLIVRLNVEVAREMRRTSATRSKGP